MAGWKSNMWLVMALAGLILAMGCSGVLYEKDRSDGGVQRLRLDGGEGWSDFDTTPRYRSQKSKDLDDYYIMLKNEATF